MIFGGQLEIEIERLRNDSFEERRALLRKMREDRDIDGLAGILLRRTAWSRYDWMAVLEEAGLYSSLSAVTETDTEEAAGLLGQIPEPAACEHLVIALRQDGVYARNFVAVQALKHFRDATAVQLLVETLTKNHYPAMRETAARALGEAGNCSPHILDSLRAVSANDVNPEV